MSYLADPVLNARQIVLRGHVADAVTGQQLSDYTVKVDCRVDSRTFGFPITLNYLPLGGFAAWLVPAQLPAELAAASEVELSVQVNAPGHSSAQLSQTLPGSHFLVQDHELNLRPGTRMRALSGEPLDFRFQLPPDPVALRGIVIYEHDPARPVAAARVRPQGLPASWRWWRWPA